MLILCLYQTSIQRFKSLIADPEKLTVCIAAFTASAAKNVERAPLYALLGLSPFYDSLLPKNDSKLAKLRDFLSPIRILIIDEISRDGNFLFNRVDQSLRQIRHVDVEFGGLNIICVGDLFQLPPIQDCHVFQKSRRLAKNEFQKNLWELFKMHELKLIMPKQIPNGAPC